MVTWAWGPHLGTQHRDPTWGHKWGPAAGFAGLSFTPSHLGKRGLTWTQLDPRLPGHRKDELPGDPGNSPSPPLHRRN
jgi:hypothetical protein